LQNTTRKYHKIGKCHLATGWIPVKEIQQENTTGKTHRKIQRENTTKSLRGKKIAIVEVGVGSL
jgi:hypothetical protein